MGEPSGDTGSLVIHVSNVCFERHAMKTVGEILAEKPERKGRPVMAVSESKEVPQWPCWTFQLNADRYSYKKAPSYDQDGAVMTFWQAHPEHWKYRCLEDLLCDTKVVRMCTMCDPCHRKVIAWEREYWAERRLKQKREEANGR